MERRTFTNEIEDRCEDCNHPYSECICPSSMYGKVSDIKQKSYRLKKRVVYELINEIREKIQQEGCEETRDKLDRYTDILHEYLVLLEKSQTL